MEKLLKISTGDGHWIYGTLSYRGRRPERVVVFVHGMTGYQDEAPLYNCAKALNKQGIAALRISLYGWRPGARKFHHCSIRIHGRDIRRVVQRLRREKFSSIGLVGHSLGGPSILAAGTAGVGAVVLWDPTSERFLKSEERVWHWKYDRRIKSYFLDWGIVYLAGTKFYKERKSFPAYSKLLAAFTAPTLVICAGGGIVHEEWRECYQKLPPPRKLVVIPKAGHCFVENDTMDRLISETTLWFKRHLKAAK